ncbi:hypothetical protein DFP72DRAFT_555276 [Ephemerocybe angulata]|uniref:Uncharacterized protein n=1 Tax=Ephemerocybe angulata TaxID=980116 RepID=A0A8H6HLH8_9AGAR|nr:hypothetical protein DFP72DRAFT_555276 [Tulosesus angulatus]
MDLSPRATKAAILVSDSLSGTAPKPPKRKRDGDSEGGMGRDEGNSDEVPTSQPDADAGYQKGLLENAKKRAKRGAEVTAKPEQVVVVKDSDDEDDPIEAYDESGDKLSSAAKQPQSKANQRPHTPFPSNPFSRVITRGYDSSRTHPTKSKPIAKEVDKSRGRHPEPSSDDELGMPCKTEGSRKPLSSSSKTSKPSSSNSLPRTSSNSTTASTKYPHRESEAASTNPQGDGRKLAASAQSQLNQSPVVLSPFAEKLPPPPVLVNEDEHCADHRERRRKYPEQFEEGKKVQDSMKPRRDRPTPYTSTPFKPPSSNASSNKPDPSASTSSTNPIKTRSTRSNYFPPAQSDPTGRADAGPSRDRATSSFESMQDKAILNLQVALETPPGSLEPDSCPPEPTEPFPIEFQNTPPVTRSRTKQALTSTPIDVDSFIPTPSKPPPNNQDSTLARKTQKQQERVRVERTRTSAQQQIATADRVRADAEAQLKRTQALLQARTEELSVAQAFMVTADRVSVAEVVRAVEEVNDLVFQCAVDLSDAVLDARATRRAKGTDDVDRAKKEKEKEKEKERAVAQEAVGVEWGEGLVRRLSKDIVDAHEGEESTVLFEAMLQNMLINMCAGVIQTLCFTDSAVDQHLKGVWERVKRAHEPSIAKNWLSMTAKHASETAPIDHSNAALGRVAGGLRSLMLVAGWQGLSSLSDEAPIIAGKVKTLIAKALCIREMTMEGVLSAEVEVFAPPNDWLFDESCMVDAYAFEDGPTRPGEKGNRRRKKDLKKTVCATALGVRWCKTKPKGGEANGEKETRVELVLKPKVLLYSTLEEGEV